MNRHGPIMMPIFSPKMGLLLWAVPAWMLTPSSLAHGDWSYTIKWTKILNPNITCNFSSPRTLAFTRRGTVFALLNTSQAMSDVTLLSWAMFALGRLIQWHLQRETLVLSQRKQTREFPWGKKKQVAGAVRNGKTSSDAWLQGEGAIFCKNGQAIPEL